MAFARLQPEPRLPQFGEDVFQMGQVVVKSGAKDNDIIKVAETLCGVG